jgi:hypothetical protein
MSDSNTNNADTNNTNQDSDKNQNNSNQNNQQTNEDPVEKLVKERVSEAVKDIKTKLDSAYGARDEAMRKLADIEQKQKERELEQLKKEGKEKEALELQLSEERAKRETLERRTIELTRDLELRNSLSGYDFRNDTAIDMAYREIVAQLIQNEQGVWVHKSGISVKDFVKQFTEQDSNSFLLKPKVSSGAGTTTTQSNSSSGDNSKKSLFSMSQDDVLKLAREGKLPPKR